MTAQILEFPARAVDTGERGQAVPYVAGKVAVSVGDILLVCISRQPYLDIWTAWPVMTVGDGCVDVLGGPNGKSVEARYLLDGREARLFRRADHRPSGFDSLWFKGWTSQQRAETAFGEVAL